MQNHKLIENPYRPGAGHPPPFLAGRATETDNFRRLLHQSLITENVLITGLRGFGKTVLLNSMRQLAEKNDWLWVGNDLSESASLSEDRLALRIITDLAQAIADKLDRAREGASAAGGAPRLSRLEGPGAFTFDALKTHYEQAAGLPSDRLRSVIQKITSFVHLSRLRGLVLAYDEAQCLSDNAERNQFPMSMLIETVSALQRKEGLCPCILVLCGLPQVFDALTETRTYTERMFHVMPLDRLSRDETTAALLKPLQEIMPPLHASRELVEQLLENGGTLGSDARSSGCRPVCCALESDDRQAARLSRRIGQPRDWCRRRIFSPGFDRAGWSARRIGQPTCASDAAITVRAGAAVSLTPRSVRVHHADGRDDDPAPLDARRGGREQLGKPAARGASGQAGGSGNCRRSTSGGEEAALVRVGRICQRELRCFVTFALPGDRYGC